MQDKDIAADIDNDLPMPGAESDSDECPACQRLKPAIQPGIYIKHNLSQALLFVATGAPVNGTVVEGLYVEAGTAKLDQLELLAPLEVTGDIQAVLERILSVVGVRPR